MVVRRVDEDARRDAIGAALWRVVLEEGMAAVSTRRVAEAAGVSLGALTHWFPAQADLLLHTMVLVDRRTAARLEAANLDVLLQPGAGPGALEGTAREITQRVLEAFLPLTHESREELTVAQEFNIRARTDPHLRAEAARQQRESLEFTTVGMQALHAAGALQPGMEPSVLVHELVALTDGLSLQAVLFPDDFPPDKLREVVRSWVHRVVRP